MMDWPVIDPGIREYLRHQQMELPGQLKELQEEASQRRVPVIPHETVVFLDWLFDLIQPKEVLEIGTAVGFSTLLMAERVAEGGRVTTIERNPQMIEEALTNISKFNMEDRITVLEGDAAERLQAFPLVSVKPTSAVRLREARSFPKVTRKRKLPARASSRSRRTALQRESKPRVQTDA